MESLPLLPLRVVCILASVLYAVLPVNGISVLDGRVLECVAVRVHVNRVTFIALPVVRIFVLNKPSVLCAVLPVNVISVLDGRKLECMVDLRVDES